MGNSKNKIIYDGNVLIDLTGDTATADKVLDGYIFHLKSGDITEGTCTYDADTSDATASASEILDTKTGYVNGNKIIGSMPNRGAVTGVIDSIDEEYTIQAGYHDGSGKVSIDAIEQAKLIPSNIREDVTILGITGTMSGSEDVKAQSKTTTPTSSQQVIVPDSGYNYLTQVTINAIPYDETLNAAGGYTVTIG